MVKFLIISQDLFAKHAMRLERQKRWQEAETAWVAAGEPETAIKMYRRNSDFASMFRAVSQHKPVRIQPRCSHMCMTELFKSCGPCCNPDHFSIKESAPEGGHAGGNSSRWRCINRPCPFLF